MGKVIKQGVVLSAFMLITAVLLSCAAQQKKVDASQYSGFLHDYSRLEKMPDDGGLRWISDALQGYDKVLIDPVVLHPDPGTSRVVLLNGIKVHLDNGLRAALKNKVSLVSDVGPGVVRLRPAITGVVSETEGLKAYEFIPIALIFAGAKTATGTRAKTAQVFLEVELSDSETGNVVGQVVRKGLGKQAETDALTFKDVQPILDEWIKNGSENLARMLKR